MALRWSELEIGLSSRGCRQATTVTLFVLVLTRAAEAAPPPMTPSAGGGMQGATRTPETVCGKTKGTCW